MINMQSHIDLSNHEMIKKARTVLKPMKLAHDNTAEDVACALLTTKGNLYYGVCMDISSGIGFCAEHAAIAAMITAGESAIAKIVAVWGEDTVLPPCGRCREFIYQVDEANYEHCEVILSEDRSVKLRELLPHPWHEVWQDQAGSEK